VERRRVSGAQGGVKKKPAILRFSGRQPHILARSFRADARRSSGLRGRPRTTASPFQEHQMNKMDMVEAVAKKLDTSKAQAGEIVDVFFAGNGIIAGELKKGGKVQIAGFGNFETRKRAARQGRNPQTGKTITIKAATVPAFRAGKGLKDLVNKK
jgi:DNA-binding protein HU-beta